MRIKQGLLCCAAFTWMDITGEILGDVWIRNGELKECVQYNELEFEVRNWRLSFPEHDLFKSSNHHRICFFSFKNHLCHLQQALENVHSAEPYNCSWSNYQPSVMLYSS